MPKCPLYFGSHKAPIGREDRIEEVVLKLEYGVDLGGLINP